ncbi:MAG: hypothetical protein LBI01_03970 [Elusimicrobium sp.]|jgi:hypothetical protein|nr:hypothetical protein [Elusimicrobium sp.]
MNDLIKETTVQILAYVQSNKSVTAWQIKTALRLRSSLLYLSLGVLVSEGKVKLEENGTDYTVATL